MINENVLNELREQIIQANDAYRVGKPIMSDSDFDKLAEKLEQLSPNDELLTTIGHVVLDPTRKSKLPIDMASMNKFKSVEAIFDWCRLKGISVNEDVILTGKYDGLSLCTDEVTEKDAWTRGDGEFGQKSDEHYKLINNHLTKKKKSIEYAYGEVVMRKDKFESKYSEEFANPRNLVAGLLNSKTVKESLRDCDYIKYGAVGGDFETKQDILDALNEGQEIKVPYTVCKISELTEDSLIALFKEYSEDYEIDGLIIEINDIALQNKLGRETSSNNPVWARAFKHPSFEQAEETEVLGLSWNISKQGLLKPVIHVRPVKLDGVTVSNVTGNNARFIKDMGIGIGSRVIVKRSGMVIPIIVEVLETVDFVMPDGDIEWNEAGIELITIGETDEQRLKMNISFFVTLETDNVSEGVITQLWEAGYTTIEEILNLTKTDLENIERFGKRKATIVYNAIKKATKDVELSKLQHATGIFRGLGSRKLVNLEHFTTKPTVDEVMSIEGFAEKSAQTYVDSYDAFFDFIKDLPVTIAEKKEVVLEGNDLEGKAFVFSGVRRKDLNEIIESRGGKIVSGVSKNSTHLIMKATGSGSSKEVKAQKLGVTIMTVDQLEKMLA